MAYSVTPLSGVALATTTTTNTNSAGTAIPTFGPLGTQVFGSDGKRYVFAKAAGTITPSAACSVSAVDFTAVADTGGTYDCGAADTVVAGDYAWFGKASV
jgi:hypothetical protein